MNRKGFTVIELVVVVMIVLILAMMIVGKSGCTGYYSQTQTGVYQCVKTYTTMSEGESSKRVDLRPSGGGMVQTMRVDDDVIMGQYNSATIYAQFEQGKWYNITATGFRQEGMMSLFPNITDAQPTTDPTR